jgi:hypothetical protein
MEDAFAAVKRGFGPLDAGNPPFVHSSLNRTGKSYACVLIMGILLFAVEHIVLFRRRPKRPFIAGSTIEGQ